MKTLPKPTTSPRPLTTFTEMSTDEISTDTETRSFENQMIVYMEQGDMMVYHTGSCEYYAEKSNSDYIRPYWLSDIVMGGTRCTLCIPDEMYYSYIHAVSKTDVQECRNTAKTLTTVSAVSIGINIILLVCLIIRFLE